MNKVDKVIFFDGVCNVCNFAVSTLLRLDKKRHFKYSSLQGKLAQQILEHENIDTSRSFVYLSEGHLFTKAHAVIAILKQLGGIYRVLGFLISLFPIKFLNFCYSLIADNRYRFFGKKEHCRIPTKEESKLFID